MHRDWWPAPWSLAGGNPFIVKIFVNGLESGVLVLLDAAAAVRSPPGGAGAWLDRRLGRRPAGGRRACWR